MYEKIGRRNMTLCNKVKAFSGLRILRDMTVTDLPIMGEKLEENMRRKKKTKKNIHNCQICREKITDFSFCFNILIDLAHF